MSQTYQLSKSGIERLERFKRPAMFATLTAEEDDKLLTERHRFLTTAKTN